MSHLPTRLLTRLSLVLMTLLTPSAAISQQQSMIRLDGVATKWRLENYVPDNVVLWFTGSSCRNGLLLLPANATKADRDRLFATVSLSKTTNRPMFVHYNFFDSERCEIVSFGMFEQ